VTPVNNNEVKKAPRELTIKPWPAFIPRDGLVRREVHLAALDDLALDLPARISERRENFVFWVIYEDITISEVQDARTPVFTRAVPS
jgi:hypothetical protein